MTDYYKNKEIPLDSLVSLYQSVGWTNYTQYPDRLEQAFKHSLLTISAYEEGQLIGLIRVVGDGYSVVFIQDLLVASSYQRQGIGRHLLEQVLTSFQDVYQIELVTEESDKNLAFYQELGFEPLSKQNCTGMIYCSGGR